MLSIKQPRFLRTKRLQDLVDFVCHPLSTNVKRNLFRHVPPDLFVLQLQVKVISSVNSSLLWLYNAAFGDDLKFLKLERGRLSSFVAVLLGILDAVVRRNNFVYVLARQLNHIGLLVAGAERI